MGRHKITKMEVITVYYSGRDESYEVLPPHHFTKN